jgi:tetratricopeptide (TPR) repeat protein
VADSSFFTEAALLDRLTAGVRKSHRQVVFLVGSAITAPTSAHPKGVPGVAGVIDMIRSELECDALAALDAALAVASNKYQTAFSLLLAHRGQNTINDIVKRAVWQARKSPDGASQPAYVPTSATPDDTCRGFDEALEGWHLTPGVTALGALISKQPDYFGRLALTTNFDPLIQVAIGVAEGHSFRTVLHRDGNIGQTEGRGCHVIHLHGYWYGSDTLHTPRQLTQDRPRLKASVAHALQRKTLVVCGYGGWDDVFTRTLLEVIQDDKSNMEVVWTTYGSADQVDTALTNALSPGIDRGLVSIYNSIDCHTFIPKLASAWACAHDLTASAPGPVSVLVSITPSAAVAIEPAEIEEHLEDGANELKPNWVFGERAEDRPPLVDYYVGRTNEAKQLDDDPSRLVFLTGIGGQGKSALAANYLTRHRQDGRYEFIFWRDCKEERERLEAQIAALLFIILDKKVSEDELMQRPVDDLFTLFFNSIRKRRFLIVFDNVDPYVNLDTHRLYGAAERFAELLLKSETPSRVIFTCRPLINTEGMDALSLHLTGIDLAAAKELFRLRQVIASSEDIERAHTTTHGHAFWLDLAAAQISRNPEGPTLDALITSLAAGEVGLPVSMLHSIWESLKTREQLVLRGLAVAVRPIAIGQLADFLAGRVNYNQTRRAVTFLRGLNLIVVKLQNGVTEVLELHPIIRAFVTRNFPKAEQKPFVDSILSFYLAFFGIHKRELSGRVRPETADRWLEASEVYIQAGEYSQAFDRLEEVQRHVQYTGHTLQFVRIADTLARAEERWNESALPDHFDDVFSHLISTVSEMGRVSQALSLLEIYRGTIPAKNSRYINYCNLMCHHHWVNGDFFTAIKWGVEGVDLKKGSNVDTAFEAGHNLALAQRDSGAVDEALVHFLQGRKLEKVLEENEGTSTLGGAYYGNIGRCLHLMGQINNALICYKKSAREIETEIVAASVANKGYIRQWVGELMYTRGDLRSASAFFSAATACFELIAPPKAEILSRRLCNLDNYNGLVRLAAEPAERAFTIWMRAD